MVIGIDADTRRLAVAWHDRGQIRKVVEIPRTTAKGNFVADYDRDLTLLVRHAQDVGATIFLEDTYLASTRSDSAETRNVSTLKALCRVAGEIERAARQHRVPLRLVTASEWRQTVLGRTCGREECKALALTWAQTATGQDNLTEHMADAVCIAQHGYVALAADRD